MEWQSSSQMTEGPALEACHVSQEQGGGWGRALLPFSCQDLTNCLLVRQGSEWARRKSGAEETAW